MSKERMVKFLENTEENEFKELSRAIVAVVVVVVAILVQYVLGFFDKWTISNIDLYVRLADIFMIGNSFIAISRLSSYLSMKHTNRKKNDFADAKPGVVKLQQPLESLDSFNMDSNDKKDGISNVVE